MLLHSVPISALKNMPGVLELPGTPPSAPSATPMEDDTNWMWWPGWDLSIQLRVCHHVPASLLTLTHVACSPACVPAPLPCYLNAAQAESSKNLQEASLFFQNPSTNCPFKWGEWWWCPSTRHCPWVKSSSPASHR